MTLYVRLSDPVYDQISAEVRKTYANACIVWIERLENARLEENFQEYIKGLKDPNIRRLYHGTNEPVARIIIRDGVDPSFNKASACGKGVYFSTMALYSSNYSRANRKEIAFLLVCDVALGKVGQGYHNQPIPSEFNSVTDNPKKPSMFIVDKPEAVVPRYLVAFHPFAQD